MSKETEGLSDQMVANGKKKKEKVLTLYRRHLRCEWLQHQAIIISILYFSYVLCAIRGAPRTSKFGSL